MVGLTGEAARGGGGWGLTATPVAAAAGWMEGQMEGWLQAQDPSCCSCRMDGRKDGGRATGTAPGRAGRRREGARLRQLPAIQSCTLNHTSP